MDPVGGWVTIAVSVAVILGTWFRSRGKASSWIFDAGSGLGGVGLGIGGLLLVQDPGTPSWFLTPMILGVAAIIHRRLLFAGEGPLRT